MFFTVEKLKQRIPEIIAAAIRAEHALDDVQTAAAPGISHDNAMTPPPPSDAWQPLTFGDMWGAGPGEDPRAPRQMYDWGIPVSGGHNHWLQATFRVPDVWRGQNVLFTMPWQGRNQASIEAIVYLNGKALAGLDEFHHSILLPTDAHAADITLQLRCYLPFATPFEGVFLRLRDPAIFQLGHGLRAALGAVETFPDSDPRRAKLLERLNAVYNTLDLREGWHSDLFVKSAHAALEKLQTTLTADLELGARPTVVSTGHAHLDTAWLWPLWRSHQKVAHTVATALHLMDRYPDYHFSMSQPQVYTFLKQDDPELYTRLKARVAEGRFEPVGVMWIEPDCNVPSGEALVRQITHGARFLADEFGQTEGRVIWLPDVFGYSAALPQLMRLAGIQTFMTTKISWNQFNRMPNDTFRWRGIDGTDVLAHFVTAPDKPEFHVTDTPFYTYNGMMTSAQAAGTWQQYRQKDIHDEVLYIYGYGDGGGGPTEEMLEAANVLKDFPGFPRVQTGRADRFFERLYDHVYTNPNLPTWVGELYLEYHRGTYTSQARTKHNNRAAELLLREAEWFNAWAHSLGQGNQQAKLDDAWKLVLLNQFHDILPGSSVPLVYVDSNAQFAEVQRIGSQIRAESAAALLMGVQHTGTEVHTEPALTLAVFNSLCWERTEPVALPAEALLADASADTTQTVEQISGEKRLLVEAVVPPFGYTTLRKAAAPRGHILTATDHQLTNEWLRLELDEHGEIASLYDIEHARETVAPGTTLNQLIAYEDRPLNWSAWDIDIFYEEKPYPLHDITSWRVLETGPLRAAVEITRQLGKSTVRQRICMVRGSRRIDFMTEIDWQERQTLLRALFPLRLNTTRATCEIQFGAVERPTHRNTSWDWARFEVCAHRWVDMSEGDYGVALLNDGKYGHSLHDNVIGLSLLKSAVHPDPEADRGLHRFTYSLYPHTGDWRTGQITRRAYELNAPLWVAHSDSKAYRANAPEDASLLSTPTDHIVVETVKVAEDGNGLIVRLYEAHNTRGHAELIFNRPIAKAVETDLLERDGEALTVSGSHVIFEVRPFEVKTLRVWLV